MSQTKRSSKRKRKTKADQSNPEQTPPNPVWRGVLGGRYKPLSDLEQQQVHESVLNLLENPGLSQANQSMIDRVCAAGGEYKDNDRLIFPRELVMDCLDKGLKSITLHGRQPGLDIELSGNRIHTSSGGAAPSIRDSKTGLYRPSTARDLFEAARVADHMEHIHHFSRSLVVTDAQDNFSLDINTAYACLSGTYKPVSMSICDYSHIPAVAEICYELAGSEQAFREKPFMTIMICHVVPPMRFATEACDSLEAAILAGFPVQIISAGQAGATSPATMAGSLVQAIAETVAGYVYAVLVDPKAKAIFAPKPLVADLRTGAMSGGGGEQAVLMAAAAQMGKFYNLPTSSIAGITDSKIPDAQHGYEKNLAVSLAAHAGSNLITQACGMQASLLGASLESYVIDNDMLGGILRSVRGIEASMETLSEEIIREVCNGEGHYLGHPQTYARMKSDYVYPEVGDRKSPADWEADGAKDMFSRAQEVVSDILKKDQPSFLPDALDRKIRDRYDLLI